MVTDPQKTSSTGKPYNIRVVSNHLFMLMQEQSQDVCDCVISTSTKYGITTKEVRTAFSRLNGKTADAVYEELASE